MDLDDMMVHTRWRKTSGGCVFEVQATEAKSGRVLARVVCHAPVLTEPDLARCLTKAQRKEFEQIAFQACTFLASAMP